MSPKALQEVQQGTLDLLWKATWWREYAWSRDPAKHRAEEDVEYFTVLALKRSSFSNVGAFALKEFPNTVMRTSSRRTLLSQSAKYSHAEVEMTSCG